jgi:RNA polymerase subunit RPABC4/transcription elongation factor Spt4
MIASEENILDAIAKIGDEDVRESLVDVLTLMAVYDGELVQEERDFLSNAAERLNVPLDLEQVEKKADEYRVTVEKNAFRKIVENPKESTAKAIGVAGQAVDSAKDVTAIAGNKVTGAFSKMRRRKKAAKVRECVNCHSEVPVEYGFCPTCGQAMDTEKRCVSCNEVLPIDFAFCPYCGASQEK